MSASTSEGSDRAAGELRPEHIDDALDLITREHAQVLAGVDHPSWARSASLLLEAPAVFTVGTGRSGLALEMAAMRFMHLGKSSYVAGDTTTPAIGPDDLLVAASGSGTTKRVVQAARSAADQGAHVLAITTDPASELASLATEVLTVPAADKEDFEGTTSAQYAGSLFEQSVLILCDALFHTLWQSSGTQAQELWRLHANLE